MWINILELRLLGLSGAFDETRYISLLRSEKSDAPERSVLIPVSLKKL
jgi:hypothetical protein